MRKYIVRILWTGWSQDEWAYSLEGARAVRDMALKSRGAQSAKIFELREVE